MSTIKHRFSYPVFLCLLLSVFLFSQAALAADRSQIDAQIASIPSDWPQSPDIASQAAILVETNSGTILYAKNATQSMFPASTTKLMTALLALQNCALDDIIKYDAKAVLSLTPGSSHIGLKVGDSLSVEDSLYGLLLPSANEVANGLALHISGSFSEFANLMNQTADSLGCINTHFANANGLHDVNHTTCAYDLYRIMAACIRQNDFIRIASRSAYYRTADAVLDRDIPMGTTNQMIKKDSEYYEPSIICGKTGWTEQAGRCLVTYASQDNLDLICVVMNSEAPNQYSDTKMLLQYGFRNFKSVQPYTADTQLNPEKLLSGSPLGMTEETVSLLELDASSRILIPADTDFDMLTRSMETHTDGSMSVIYSLGSYPLGSVPIVTKSSDVDDLLLNPVYREGILNTIPIQPLYTINIWLVAIAGGLILAILFLLIFTIRYYLAPEKKTKKEENHQYHML